MKTTTYLLICVCFCFGFVGCAPREARLLTTPVDPASDWDLTAVTEHVLYFNSIESEGRKTGTRGYFHSANYVAARLKEYRLHPTLLDEYRQQVAIKLRTPERIRIYLSERDTLNLVQGQDFILLPTQDDFDVLYSPAITSQIQAGRYKLTEEVRSQEQITTGAIHVGGFIPGRHPVLRDSLVIVLAPLDGMGIQGLISYTDGSDFGIASAALLEFVRRFSVMQDRWSFFGPSVLVQFVSGTRQGCQGPEAALRNLPWDKKRVQTIIVMDDAQNPSCDWSKLIREQKILAPLHTLHPNEWALPEAGTMPFYPLVRRDRRIRTPELSFVVQEALKMSSATMELILAN